MRSLPEFYPAMAVVAAVAMEAVAAVKAMIVVVVPNMKLTARGSTAREVADVAVRQDSGSLL